MLQELLNIKVLLFDLDDTLIVERKSVEEAFVETSGLLKDEYQIEPVRFANSVRLHARQLWYKLPTIDYCLKIGISSWEGLWATFEGKHKQLRLLEELAEEYRIHAWNNALLDYGIKNKNLATKLSETFRYKRNEKHILFPDTIQVLKILSKSYRLGVITNGAPDLQWIKINKSCIKEFFEHIIISGDVNYGKPAKQIFKAALNKFHISGDNALFIGDSLSTDILGAHSSGIKAIWLNRNKNKLDGDIIPDYIISDLMELLHIVK